ncbi:MAG: hypothetical protein ACRDSL_14085 [Pseudonocardiaceae bacterium]
MYVLREPSTWDFEKSGHGGKRFASGDLVARSAYLILSIEGALDRVLKQTECDFVYYVTRGSGTFRIAGEEEDVSLGDLVVVPAGTAFTYRGDMTLLLIATPPWSEEQEVDLGASGW